MKLIVVDGAPLIGSRGISTTVRSLIAGIEILKSEDRFEFDDLKIVVLVPNSVKQATFESLNQVGSQLVFKGCRLYINQIFWESLVVPWNCLLLKPSVFHFTSGTGGLLPWFLSKITGVSIVVTVHDLSFFARDPEISGSSNIRQFIGKLYRRYATSRILDVAICVITVSNFVKNLIEARFGNKINVRVVHNSLQPVFHPDSSEIVGLSRRENKLLVISGNSRQKNFKRILRVLSSFNRDYPDWEISVVGLGSRKPLTNFDINFYSDLTPNQMSVHYRESKIILVGSLYESFALPIIEGISSGAVVCGSATGAINELVGEMILKFDPRDEEDVLKALSKAVSMVSQEFVQEVVDAHRLVCQCKYSAAIQARETLSVYNAVSA